jgi:hypothetical protein
MPRVTGRDERREGGAFAALAFAIVAPAAYVCIRVAERIRDGAPSLEATVQAHHVAFYWRCATACFWGGLGALLAWYFARSGRDPRPAATWLARAALPAGVLFAALAWLLP